MRSPHLAVAARRRAALRRRLRRRAWGPPAAAPAPQSASARQRHRRRPSPVAAQAGPSPSTPALGTLRPSESSAALVIRLSSAAPADTDHARRRLRGCVGSRRRRRSDVDRDLRSRPPRPDRRAAPPRRSAAWSTRSTMPRAPTCWVDARRGRWSQPPRTPGCSASRPADSSDVQVGSRPRARTSARSPPGRRLIVRRRGCVRSRGPSRARHDRRDPVPGRGAPAGPGPVRGGRRRRLDGAGVGGTSAAGDTAVIQAVDLGRGTATVVGRLPESMSHATALVIGRVLVVAAGRHAAGRSTSVLEVDPDVVCRPGRRTPASRRVRCGRCRRRRCRVPRRWRERTVRWPRS